MAKPAVEFAADGERLLLIYRPRDDTAWVRRRFDAGKKLVIKGTFHLMQDNLVTGDFDPGGEDVGGQFEPDGLENFEELMVFVVASADGNYFHFDRDVLPIEVDVFVSKKTMPTWKWFSAERNVSILAVVASLQPSRIMIGGEAEDAIPVDEYERLLDQFPTRHEIKRYVQTRVAVIARQYTDASVDAEALLNRYVNKRVQTKSKDILNPLHSLEIAKFELLLQQLQHMLNHEEGYSEKVWQEGIIQIIRLLNPKYIEAFTNVPISDADSKNKRFLDILLVDASGNVDVIEIKKPFNKSIISAARYRDNHIPLRELSGAVMQIEKYLRHLNRSGPAGEDKLRKHFGSRLPSDFKIKITNPAGIIIMGRDNRLSPNQRRDFEIARRHYKHIADIVTYDDLLRRLEFILSQLKVSV